jgi:hypothetical protein
VAPPDRSDHPRRTDTRADIGSVDLNASADSRMSENALRLASWVEWLLHPEEHDYDRTVIYPDGTKREEPQRVTKANPTPGNYDPVDLPFESVVPEYEVLQYVDGMAAFSKQKVERHDSYLAIGTAAMKNVWWLCDKRVLELVNNFPSEQEWSGDAANRARAFVGKLGTAATQMNKIAAEFTALAPHYSVIVKTARDNFDKAAADLVTAFEEKFATKAPPSSIDVMGVVLATVTAGAVTYITAGAALPLITDAAITAAWSATFSEAAKKVVNDVTSLGKVDGALWHDLVQSYMVTQAKILNDAIESINSLNDKLAGLINQFNQDVGPFLKEFAG